MKRTLKSNMTIRLRSPANKGRDMADKNLDSPPWPSVAGPKQVERDPKLWKAPKLDMNSSLAFLRGELAAMQMQDRALHKQLLALQASILNLKADLSTSWEQQLQDEVTSPAQTPTVVAKVEVLESRTDSPKPQVVHVKQDSGFLTDEESDEEKDVFNDSEETQIRSAHGRSISLSNLYTASKPPLNSHAVDGNNNVVRDWRSQSVRVTSKNNGLLKGFNLSQPRERAKTYTEGQFHRVTSMPVINELPAKENFELKSSKIFKTFALSGTKTHGKYKEISGMGGNTMGVKRLPVAFGNLARHESVPVFVELNGGHSRTSTDSRDLGARDGSTLDFRSHPRGRPVLTRASSQQDVRRAWNENNTPEYKDMKLYKVYRTASQISLV